MPIVRWSPLQDLGQVFDEDFQISRVSRIAGDLAVDIYEKSGSVVAEMHLPDIDPENIDINIENNYLRISGLRGEDKEEKEKNYYYREISRGSFERAMRLPSDVNGDKAEASYENGVLKIVIPKKEEEKKKIKVSVKK